MATLSASASLSLSAGGASSFCARTLNQPCNYPSGSPDAVCARCGVSRQAKTDRSSGGAVRLLNQMTPEERAKRDAALTRFKNSKELAPKQLGAPLDVSALRAAFLAADADGSGEADLQELTNMMVALGLDENTARRHAEGFFRLCDKDSSGSVSFEEFVNEYTRMSVFKAIKTLQFHFRDADKDGNGTLSKVELQSALALTLGETSAASLIDQIFDEIDADHSGDITLDEIASWHFNKAQMLKTDRKKLSWAASVGANTDSKASNSSAAASASASANATPESKAAAFQAQIMEDVKEMSDSEAAQYLAQRIHQAEQENRVQKQLLKQKDLLSAKQLASIQAKVDESDAQLASLNKLFGSFNAHQRQKTANAMGGQAALTNQDMMAKLMSRGQAQHSSASKGPRNATVAKDAPTEDKKRPALTAEHLPSIGLAAGARTSASTSAANGASAGGSASASASASGSANASSSANAANRGAAQVVQMGTSAVAARQQGQAMVSNRIAASASASTSAAAAASVGGGTSVSAGAGIGMGAGGRAR